MTPPTIATPATILRFFIIFLLNNSALSGVVSVGGEEGEGGGPSGVKWCDGASTSDIEWCEGTEPSDAEDSDPPEANEYRVGIGSSIYKSVDDNGWCEGVNWPGGE